MTSEDSDFQPLNLRVFDKPQKEWHPKVVSWEEVMRETELFCRYYIEHFDSPEKRLRAKNPKPFRMD